MDLEKIINSIDQEPYYQEKEGVLYCADCMDILPQIPKESVDLVLTDPPYNSSEREPILIKRMAGSDYKTVKEEWDKNFTPDPYFKAMEDLSKQYLIFTDFHLFDVWIRLSKKNNTFRQILHMIKTNPIPPARKVYWYSVQYIIWGVCNKEYCFHKEFALRDIFYYTSHELKNIDHPTAKPLSVIKKLLITHSNTNDIVFDPFLGSGTTAVASKKLGRQWIGIEISQKYCDIAVRRLKKVQFGCSLKNEKQKQKTLEEL